MQMNHASSSFDEVRQIAADVLGVAVQQVTSDLGPHKLDSWDSVQHLNLILAVEQRFGFQFAPEEMEATKTIGSIVAAVDRKTGD
jgi:acyl carrier protein